MKLVFKSLIALLVLVIVQSCSYDFADDYFNDIDLIENNITVTLDGLINGDELNNSQTVQYSIRNAPSTSG